MLFYLCIWYVSLLFIYVYMNVRTCLYMYVCVCMYLRMYVGIFYYVCMVLCAYVFINMCVFIYRSIYNLYERICIYKRTYIHICVCVCVCVCTILIKKSLQPPVSLSGLPSSTLSPSSLYLHAYLVIQRRQMNCGST